jgi:uncharacterized membrane protein
MFGSEKKNLYVGGLVIVVLIVMYFLHLYQTKRLIHDELKNIEKEKKRKLIKQMMKREKANSNLNLNKQIEYPDFSDEENPNQQDMDSYVDPGDNMNQMPQQQQPSNSSRIPANNIMMRDMMDGSQQ